MITPGLGLHLSQDSPLSCARSATSDALSLVPDGIADGSYTFAVVSKFLRRCNTSGGVWVSGSIAVHSCSIVITAENAGDTTVSKVCMVDSDNRTMQVFAAFPLVGKLKKN